MPTVTMNPEAIYMKYCSIVLPSDGQAAGMVFTVDKFSLTQKEMWIIIVINIIVIGYGRWYEDSSDDFK